MIYPILNQGTNLPPTIYSIMQSLVNYDRDEKTKIKDMWKKGREYLFNFDYTLTSKISKEDFEHNILNHYLMRRINYDTVTLFQIMLENRLVEVLPKYNMLWDCLDGWDVFKSGSTTREYKENTSASGSTSNNSVDNNTITSNGNSKITSTEKGNDTTNNSGTSHTTLAASNTSEDKKALSDTPQGRISEVENAEYISEYSKANTSSSDNSSSDTTNSTTVTGSNEKSISTGNETTNTTGEKRTKEDTGTSKDNKETTIKETVDKSVDNQAQLLITFMNEYNNIWSLLYRDLDTLFFGLV